jgi:hypothetical protein
MPGSMTERQRRLARSLLTSLAIFRRCGAEDRESGRSRA